MGCIRAMHVMSVIMRIVCRNGWGMCQEGRGRYYKFNIMLKYANVMLAVYFMCQKAVARRIWAVCSCHACDESDFADCVP